MSDWQHLVGEPLQKEQRFAEFLVYPERWRLWSNARLRTYQNF